MIILDPGEAGAGTKDGKYVGLTLRHPSAAFTRTNSLLLPDYNTSEALYWNDTSQKVPPKRPRVNPQILKAAAYAFAAYLFLSLVIVLPLAILVSSYHYTIQLCAHKVNRRPKNNNPIVDIKVKTRSGMISKTPIHPPCSNYPHREPQSLILTRPAIFGHTILILQHSKSRPLSSSDSYPSSSFYKEPVSICLPMALSHCGPMQLSTPRNPRQFLAICWLK